MKALNPVVGGTLRYTPIHIRLMRIKRDEKTGCWIWQGTGNRQGYGMIRYDGRPQPAHRVAYEIMVGPIPAGMTLDHLCRVPRCINPNHLEIVTHRINVLRGIGPTAKNAKKKACLQGHDLTGRNLITRRDGRECRTCANRRSRIYQRGRRARLAANSNG